MKTLRGVSDPSLKRSERLNAMNSSQSISRHSFESAYKFSFLNNCESPRGKSNFYVVLRACLRVSQRPILKCSIRVQYIFYWRSAFLSNLTMNSPEAEILCLLNRARLSLTRRPRNKTLLLRITMDPVAGEEELPLFPAFMRRRRKLFYFSATERRFRNKWTCTRKNIRRKFVHNITLSQPR